jgi:hypothetical protein
MPQTPRFIEPQWPAPASVFALTTTRVGGVSAAPYDTFNLGDHVGDAARSVATNRDILDRTLPAGTHVSWLSQVHGVEVVEAAATPRAPQADAQWSRSAGMACAVLTADCLPVLFCSTNGEVVAAAHAGWRGLLAGVLESTVLAMAVAPQQLLVWLGPAIGPSAFEVGSEVRDQFLASAAPADATSIASFFAPNAGRAEHWFADLYGLAQHRLARLGITRVYGGGYCTVSDSGRFFSYRRDGQTGRMATLIVRC